jgi:hypothetical protein
LSKPAFFYHFLLFYRRKHVKVIFFIVYCFSGGAEWMKKSSSTSFFPDGALRVIRASPSLEPQRSRETSVGAVVRTVILPI